MSNISINNFIAGTRPDTKIKRGVRTGALLMLVVEGVVDAVVVVLLVVVVIVVIVAVELY